MKRTMLVTLLLVPVLTLTLGCQLFNGGGGLKGIGLDISFTKQEDKKTPTFTDAEVWRALQEWEEISKGKWVTTIKQGTEKKNQVLINGTPVDRDDYPATVRIFQGGGSCTAAIVGPRVLLTAAHCTDDNGVVTFKTWNGVSYKAKMTRAPGYPAKDLDIALGVIDREVPIKYRSIHTEMNNKPGDEVQLIGYGCIRPGGGGGNDNVLRTGKSLIVKAQGYDLVLKGGEDAALCYGDSGGPVFHSQSGNVIAVNSKGNIQDTSYVTRVYTGEALEFINDFASSNRLIVCGLNQQCANNDDPKPNPPPKEAGEFEFENDEIYIKGNIK